MAEPRVKRRLSLTVTSYTLVGGHDNPNCFSLAADGGDVRIVNMKLGPFERVAAEFLSDGVLLANGVEAEMLAPGVAILTDPRIPAHELHNDRWCSVCCRFHLLPEVQQRAMLQTHVPNFHNGQLTSWSVDFRREPRDDETVTRDLEKLRAIGAA